MFCVNRVVQLAHGRGRARRFDHVPGGRTVTPNGSARRGHAVSFLEAGLPLRTTGPARDGANRLFVATPGLEFSCAHDEDHPADCCLS
jgi:hypothetical protein